MRAVGKLHHACGENTQQGRGVCELQRDELQHGLREYFHCGSSPLFKKVIHWSPVNSQLPELILESSNLAMHMDKS